MTVDLDLSEDEYQDRRSKLIEDAKEEHSQRTAEQEKALQEIAQGENLERYETVFMGDLEMQVRAWVPGSVVPQIQTAASIADSEDVERVMESMETMINALAEISVEGTYDSAFWRAYFDRYGPEGMIVAVEKVLGPALENMEDNMPDEQLSQSSDAAQGFRTDEDGNVVRSGN